MPRSSPSAAVPSSPSSERSTIANPSREPSVRPSMYICSHSRSKPGGTGAGTRVKRWVCASSANERSSVKVLLGQRHEAHPVPPLYPALLRHRSSMRWLVGADRTSGVLVIG